MPGDLPDSGIKPSSLASPALTGKFFTTSATWEALGPDGQGSIQLTQVTEPLCASVSTSVK